MNMHKRRKRRNRSDDMLIKMRKQRTIAGRNILPGYEIDTEKCSLLSEAEAQALIDDGVAEKVSPKRGKAAKADAPAEG